MFGPTLKEDRVGAALAPTPAALALNVAFAGLGSPSFGAASLR